MLTGVQVFKAENLFAMTMQVVEKPTPDLSMYVELPEEIDRAPPAPVPLDPEQEVRVDPGSAPADAEVQMGAGRATDPIPSGESTPSARRA